MLSASALAYEVLLMRLFSIIQWHHFAYLIISIALLGYGVAGALVAIGQDAMKARFPEVFVGAAALFGVTALGGFLLAQRVAFNPLELLWDPQQPLRLLLISLLLMVPFACAATCICLTFARFGGEPHRIYSFDILGAAAGSLGIVICLFALTPMSALQFIAGFALLAASLAAISCAGLSRWVAAILGAAAVVLALALPSGWLSLLPSEYKDLSQTLRIKGTEALAQRSSPIGVVTAVASPVVPFRDAPGLSLNAPQEPPLQIELFTDGDAPSAVTRYDGRREPLSYLDYLTSALPYHLLDRPRVLVLGAGGGQDVLQAIYHGASSIDAVELNPQVIDLVQEQFGDFSGRLYSVPTVHVHIAEARGFVASREDRYDLIQVALLDAFGASAAGLHGLSENYLYTVEALQEYLRHLTPGGLLAVTRWITLPPRDVLKMFATVRQALERNGVAAPELHLALIRGWRTATLLAKSGEFGAAEIAAIRQFCQSRSFDVAYYPGIQSGEANRYNLLERAYLFEDLQALLGSERGRFMARYKFNIQPATDDKPYFFHFFKWTTLPELLLLKERGGLPLLEWGYPVLVASLAQALLVSPILILLPLWMSRRGPSDSSVPRGLRPRIAVYFTAIGLAFMFLEIALIQKFILFLTHPVYAVATSLSAFLFFAGLGSRASQRLQKTRNTRPVMWPVIGVCAVALLYLLLLPGLFQKLMALDFALKLVLCVALLAPLGLAMGMPFPMGVAAVAASSEPLVPWAWGINACASVIGAVLATLLAIHFGFTVVVIAALLLYVVAASAAP
jgi:SAM-dependent methyltransferase